MHRSEAKEIGIAFLAALQFLVALPLALLALFSLGKLTAPTDPGHLTVEVLLILAAIAGLISPFATRGRLTVFQVRFVAINTTVVTLAFAALFSPLFKGFLH